MAKKRSSHDYKALFPNKTARSSEEFQEWQQPLSEDDPDLVKCLTASNLRIGSSTQYGSGLFLEENAYENQDLWFVGPATVTMVEFIECVHVTKTRHAYEFLAIGTVVDSRVITADNCNIMWVDLVKQKDPFLFINSGDTMAESNISVHSHPYKPLYAAVKADCWISKGSEITDFYAVHGSDIHITKRYTCLILHTS